MAGWLSSKLKEAEQFLQQIDDQAAESLGKPEKQWPKSEERRRKPKKDLDLFQSDLKDNHRQVLPGSKLVNSSQPWSAGLSGISRADQAKKGLDTVVTPDQVDYRASNSKKAIFALSNPEELQNVPGDDWTELLASPSTIAFLSPGLSSSVGSSESGASGFTKDAFSRSVSKPGKVGRSSQQNSGKLSSANPNLLSSPASHTKRLSDSDVRDFSALSTSKTETPKCDIELDPRSSNGSIQALDKGGSKDASLVLSCNTDCDSHSTNANEPLSTSMVVSSAGEPSSLPDDSLGQNRIAMKQEPELLPNTADVNRVKNDNTDGTILSQTQEHGQIREWQVVRETSPGSAFEGTDNAALLGPILDPVHDDGSKDTKVVDQLGNVKEPQPFGEPFSCNDADSFKQDTGYNTRNTILQNGTSHDSQFEHVKFSSKSRGSLDVMNDVQDKVESLNGDGFLGKLEGPRPTHASSASSGSDLESYETGSETQSDSEVGSESEDEEIERRKSAHERRIAKRKEIAAIKAAAAQVAIKEREEFVKRLKNEKLMLERIFAEREEQQGREAAELRLSMAELLQALESEKKLHSATRMEALTKESELENQNADLARTLGAIQWELEEQIAQVLKARSMVEAKKADQAELQRKLAKLRQELCHKQENGEYEVGGKVEIEEHSFEEEQADLWLKIQQCQIQVKDLELKIDSLKDSRYALTETEVELESHLSKMTDQLIQKQAQVESLSTEKATLLIRLEALSNAIQEERALASSRASRNKTGYGKSIEWDFYEDELERQYHSKSGTFSYDVELATSISSTTSPFSPVIRQLNAVFSAGMVFLRRHCWAQGLALVYIILLHLWVLFILFCHSKSPQISGSQEWPLPKNVSDLPGESNATKFF